MSDSPQPQKNQGKKRSGDDLAKETERLKKLCYDSSDKKYDQWLNRPDYWKFNLDGSLSQVG
jgi:hypothetical protein